jgi:uncharacterized protein
MFSPYPAPEDDMTTANPLDEPPDLEALDAWLLSDGSPGNCMQLSELDGFLTGVAIGPKVLLPSQYMPTIWDAETPMFDDIDQAQAITGAILSRYNEIVRSIEAGDFEPIFWQGPDGEPVATDWADGFIAAMDLDLDAWDPLVRSEDSAVHMLPILSLASDEDGGPLMEGLAPDEDGFLAEAAGYIPNAVEQIAAFWRPRRQPLPEDTTLDRQGLDIRLRTPNDP